MKVRFNFLEFNPVYFGLCLSLFAIEITIASNLSGGFIRHSLGDYLVVIFIYTFIRSFTKLTLWPSVSIVYLLAILIETSQYFNLISYLGISRSNSVDWTLGSTFDWGDILAYTLGIITVILIEIGKKKWPTQKQK